MVPTVSRWQIEPWLKGDKRQAVLLDELLQAGGDAVAHFSGLLAGVGALDFFKRVVTSYAADRRCRHRAANERFVNLVARLDAGGEIFHIFLFAAESARARITARDDLAEYREIGGNVEIALRTCHADTEACDNLVEYEQRAVFAAETLYALVEILIQRACTALWADRLNEDRRRAAAHLIETELALQIVEIVREKLLRVFKDVKRNAVRLCELGAGNTDAVGELIAPAVIGAAHLDDVFYSSWQGARHAPQPCRPRNRS